MATSYHTVDLQLLAGPVDTRARYGSYSLADTITAYSPLVTVLSGASDSATFIVNTLGHNNDYGHTLIVQARARGTVVDPVEVTWGAGGTAPAASATYTTTTMVQDGGILLLPYHMYAVTTTNFKLATSSDETGTYDVTCLLVQE